MGEEDIELTEEQVTELNELQKMFETVGWEIFVRHQQEVLDNIRASAWDYVFTSDALAFEKGKMEMLKSIIGYSNTIDARKESWVTKENSSDPV